MRKTDSELSPTKRPRSPKCEVRMTTTGVSETKWLDAPRLRMLKCGHIENNAIASDPLNKAVGRFSDEVGRHAVSYEIKEGRLVPKTKTNRRCLLMNWTGHPKKCEGQSVVKRDRRYPCSTKCCTELKQQPPKASGFASSRSSGCCGVTCSSLNATGIVTGRLAALLGRKTTTSPTARGSAARPRR
jgi:hypothetical protein